MKGTFWFEDIPVVGKLPPDLAARELRELGDEEASIAFESAEELMESELTGPGGSGLISLSWPFQDKPWQYTAHTFGHIAIAPCGGDFLPIRHAGNIEAQTALIGSRVKITLDRLRVASYPGRGTHRILFDFYAQNQVEMQTEHLHFNATYRVLEGEQAAIIGYPIFVGLNVGTEGVAFKCFTVNVKNERDEAFIGFLESDVFKAGLKLASRIQPAIAPLSEMAFNLTKVVAGRHRNVPVQDFYMGLDFSAVPTRARLAEGSYIAVQVSLDKQVQWDWDEWLYNSNSGEIVNRADHNQLIPFNYLVFSVSRYEGD